MGAFFYNPQTNFTAGEWSDDMAGRSDLAKFRNASRTIENFLPTPQGRLLTTPGTRFVAKARYAAKKCVLYPFIFSNTDALVLELGDLYMRFHTNNGRIEDAAVTITGLADSGSGEVEVTTGTHGYTTGDTIRLAGVSGGEVLNTDWVITVIDATHFDLDGSVFTGSPSGGTANKVVQIVTPYLEADLYDMHFEQRNNTWHIVNTNGTYQPRELVRNTATTFTLAVTEYTFGPFLDDNITATTINPSGTTGSITLTASAAIFLAGHVGAQFRIAGSTGSPARSGHVRITAFTSTTTLLAVPPSSLGPQVEARPTKSSRS